MAASKKSFFGSLFSFQPIAVEELRNGFQEAYNLKGLPSHSPLLSYDQKTFSFSFECDQSEVEPAQIFRGLLTEYVAKHRDEGDLLANQRIVPIDGTYIDDPVVSNELFSLDDDEDLLPISDSEASDEESAIPGLAGYPTELWKPTLSNVEVLTFDVVKALSDRTGCTFSINAHRNEARLHGGKIGDALSRLKAIEPILSLLHNHVNAHVLLIPTATENTRIDFTMPSDTVLRRIIVDPDVKSVKMWLGNKCIEQLASYVKGAKAEAAIVTGRNLTNPIQCSTGIESSTIWSEYKFTQVGDVKNRASVGDVSALGKIEKFDPLPISHYMTETESHVIKQWAGRVDESTSPEKVGSNAVLGDEPSDKPGRTRVKRADDDDDDGEEEEEGEEGEDDGKQIDTPFRSMNDALNTQFNTLKSKFGRVRIKREDGDDDSEEDEGEDKGGFQDSLSKNSDKKQDSWTYPSMPEPKYSGFRKKSSRDRPGRRRMVKADSDDEGQADGWAVAPHEGASAWGDTPFQPENPETSDNWDLSIYPNASFAGGCTTIQQKPRHQEQPSPNEWHNDSDIGPTWDLSAAPVAEQSSDSTARAPPSETLQPATQSNSWSHHEEDVGERDQITALGSSTPKASPSPIYHGNEPETPEQISSRKHRSRSSRSANRASRVSTPSGLGRDATEHNTKKPNPFALENLIDIPAAVKTGISPPTATSPSHYEVDQHILQPSASCGDVSDTRFDGDLVDVSTPEATPIGPVPPPPGFEPFVKTNSPSRQQLGTSSSISSRKGSSAGVRPGVVPSMPSPGQFQASQVNPGMDLIEMSRRRIEELQLERLRAVTELPDPSVDKLQDVDEASTRTFHRTMNQRAAKPLRSKKEVRQKRTEVLENAWGVGQSTSQGNAGDSNATDSPVKSHDFKMSAAKRKLLKGTEAMVNSGPDAAYEEQILLQSSQFIAAFRPVFHAARAFPGPLKFEIQLGQFLSPCPERAYQAKCVTVNQWHRLYDSAHGSLARAGTFTNILTRNGADVDHILKLKMPKGGGGSKLFHHGSLGRIDVRFEFHCRGKNNDEVRVVLDPKGRYQVERPFRAVGQVNLHIPGQIWDAAGLLTGSTRFPEDQTLIAAADELVKSVFVPGGRKEVEISYRLPASNEFAVKKVIMRRLSRHPCAIGGKADVQLQITEVQRLFVEARPNGVYLAYASKYEKMVDQMMVHFEVSLVSQSISQALSVNANLKVGDVTSAWTAESILQQSRTKSLLDVTRIVVSKIDGIGFHNVGSAVFVLDRESVLAAGSTAAAPNRQPPNQSQTPMQNSQPMTKKPTATQPNAAALINVPGVRGGVAQPTSQGYAVGYGGARIPLVSQQQQQQQDAADADGVVPDESASQAPEKGGGGSNAPVMPGFW